MPVPITRTDWRLDRLVTVGGVEAPPPNEDPVFEVKAPVVFGSVAEPILVDWKARPTDVDTEWVLVYDMPILAVSRRDQTPGYLSVFGSAYANAPVLIGGTYATIQSFPDPAGRTDVFAGDLQAKRARNGMSASFPNESDVVRVPDRKIGDFAQATILVRLNLRPELGNREGLATILVDDKGRRTFILTPGKKFWAQRVEEQADQELAPGGQVVDLVAVHDRVEYIMRQPPAPNTYIIDGSAIYLITSAAELDRGRFWSVQGNRTYFRLAF